MVCAILAAHVPAGSVVRVFGSRANGRSRRYSDLDLAIDAGRVLTLDETAALREAFSGSDLPWAVDVVDVRSVEEGFARLVTAGGVVLVG